MYGVILFIQTLVLYKSFSYLLLHRVSEQSVNGLSVHKHVYRIDCMSTQGPDSFYGTKGQRKVTHDVAHDTSAGKVTFQFTYATGTNNGTSVEDGQIPEIVFYT